MSRHSRAQFIPLLLLGGVATLLYTRRKAASEELVGAFGLSKALGTATANAAKAEADRKAAQQKAIAQVKKTVQNNLRRALSKKKPAAPPPPPLYVFSHEPEFVMPARRAAARIEAASGLKIHVNEPDTFDRSVPILGSHYLCAQRKGGRTYPGLGILLATGDCRIDAEFILVHELLHMLGAGHLVLPQRGVLNEGKDDPLTKITADDLALLCAARPDCTRFEPEA